MTRTTVGCVEHEQTRDDRPPPDTAIVRPLRHVRAVREQRLRQFADPAEVAQSRAARAWAWALGETSIAPVTDRHTVVPPTRAEIDKEIAEADQRMFRGDQENRADIAADILRWLIGDDDHIPIRVCSPGELVNGFGCIVRSREQLTHTLTLAAERQRNAATKAHDLDASPAHRQLTQREADYCAGVIATLAWVLGERSEAPITRGPRGDMTSREFKGERLHAQDVAEQSRYPWLADQLPPPMYGEGVKSTLTWLLGDSTTPPTRPS